MLHVLYFISTVFTIASQPTECQDQFDSSMATALTTGVISVITTALLVAGISIVVHVIVYQCVYKPRLTGVGCHRPKPGGDDYTDVADERVETTLEMEENEAYSVNERVGTTQEIQENEAYSVDERVGTTLEMEENEAYSVNERVGGLELKQNEAYGVVKSKSNS